jgi:PEP-CTERM motif
VAFFDFDNGLSSANLFGSGGFVQFESMVASGDPGGPSFVLEEASDTCLMLNCTVDSRFGTLGGDVLATRHAAWIGDVTTPVPEPHAWALLLVGLGLVGWRALGMSPAATRRRLTPCPATAPRIVLWSLVVTLLILVWKLLPAMQEW